MNRPATGAGRNCCTSGPGHWTPASSGRPNYAAPTRFSGARPVRPDTDRAADLQISVSISDPVLTAALLAADDQLSADARGVARIGLANYFAGALLLPYRQFLETAEA
ncbi:hypothetical protein H7H37_22490, partial [Mycolicibacterium insubricum]|nr:hypothetical protein [Mycolicibacterium insubricum]